VDGLSSGFIEESLFSRHIELFVPYGPLTLFSRMLSGPALPHPTKSLFDIGLLFFIVLCSFKPTLLQQPFEFSWVARPGPLQPCPDATRSFTVLPILARVPSHK